MDPGADPSSLGTRPPKELGAWKLAKRLGLEL